MKIDWNILRAAVLARAAERSTWLGVIALLAAFGIGVRPEHVELICAIGTGLAGLLLVATRDAPVEVETIVTVNRMSAHDLSVATSSLLAVNKEPIDARAR